MKRITLILIFLGFSVVAVTAQSSTDYQPKLPDYSNSNRILDPVPTAPPPPPNPIPIDGGAGFLLAAGVGYGIKRIRDQRQKKH